MPYFKLEVTILRIQVNHMCLSYCSFVFYSAFLSLTWHSDASLLTSERCRHAVAQQTHLVLAALIAYIKKSLIGRLLLPIKYFFSGKSSLRYFFSHLSTLSGITLRLYFFSKKIEISLKGICKLGSWCFNTFLYS